MLSATLFYDCNVMKSQYLWPRNKEQLFIQIKNKIMANDKDKKNSFLDGVKKGAGIAIGAGLVAGAIGFVVGGPAGGWAGFKLGAGALGGGAG